MPRITKTPNEVREDYLRSIKNGLQDIGIQNPNVSENSDYWVQATAIADQISTLFNNVEVAADALFPDTAQGDDLDRLLAQFGLERRPAGIATGAITIVCTGTTFVPQGAELVSSTGQVYTVPIGGNFSNGAIIEIRSKEAGAKNNLSAGSILSWVSTPIATQSTATVYRELIGAVDEEDDETARQRLLSRLKSPPAAANWQHVAEIAEASSSAVAKAFVYPAANGPSTVHVAVTAYPNSVTKSRQIDQNVMNGTIIPTVIGRLPEGIEVVVTTVLDVPADVSLQLTLPLAVNTSAISGAGNGTGWRDATPFPPANGSTHFFCPVTAVTDSTHFTLDSPTSNLPSPGISKISWIDRSAWQVKQATIVSYTGTGPFVLTLDQPFVGIAVGDWIFPASINAQVYLDALLRGFGNLGPGEKTDRAALLPRAIRKPQSSTAFPATVDSPMLKTVIDSSDEVLTGTFLYRSTGAANPAAVTTILTPPLPTLISDPPKIFTPRQIGIYPPFPLA